MLSLFRRRAPDPYPDPQLPPEVYELDERPLDRAPINWEPRSPELARTMTADEWTRAAARARADLEASTAIWTRPVAVIGPPPEPQRVPPPWLPWTSTAPIEAGVYWFCETDSEAVFQCVVDTFGGRLCVTERAGDSCTYRAVASLQRYWAGPCPIPELITLEDLALTC